MSHIIGILHAHHQGVTLALCTINGQNISILDESIVPTKKASSQLIATLDAALRAHSLSFKQLAYLAVNRGPAPFTTLRTALATANGLAFATGIALIGVDGISIALAEAQSKIGAHAVVIMNAFCDDLYAAWIDPQTGKEIVVCKNYRQLFSELSKIFHDKKIVFCGDGTEKYAAAIAEIGGEISGDAASLIRAIAVATEKLWQAKKTSVHVAPLYLKGASSNVQQRA